MTDTFMLHFVSIVSRGVLAINEAVDKGDSAQTLHALRSPDVGLYGVTAECAHTYQKELEDQKKNKAAEGKIHYRNGLQIPELPSMYR